MALGMVAPSIEWTRTLYTPSDDSACGMLITQACWSAWRGPNQAAASNIGNSEKVRLEDFIAAIETATGHKATRNYMDMQPGDVPATWADGTLLQRLTGYGPTTGLDEGIARFVEWFRTYYGR